MLDVALTAFAALGAIAFIAAIVLFVWPWRVEGSLKATTSGSVISLGGGAAIAGVSGSGAAILGGPGVVAVHFRKRELWRRAIAEVSATTVLAWLDELLSKPTAKPGFIGRLVARVQTWLIARTDIADLPEAALRVVLASRDVSFKGSFTCGFADPALTGKAAAVLYPIAGIVAPLGILDLSFDWSGENRIDGGAELSFRVVPARVALEGLRFGWRHVHLLRARRPVPSTITV